MRIKYYRYAPFFHFLQKTIEQLLKKTRIAQKAHVKPDLLWLNC